MKQILQFFIIIILSSIAVSLQAGDNQYYSLKQQIESQYYSFRPDSMEILLKQSEALCDTSDSWVPCYYSGILCIQLGKIYYNIDSDKAYDYFDSALDHLIEADERNENDCEIKALISCAYGKKSSLSSLSAIFLGMKAKNRIEDAYEIDNSNPGMLLIAATHLMHTPETFGGDKDRAEKFLLKALQTNNNKQDSIRIIWGRDAEIYAYLAQLEILRENKEKAKKFMDKALALEPDYGFVKYDLKPQWEKIKKNSN